MDNSHIIAAILVQQSLLTALIETQPNREHLRNRFAAVVSKAIEEQPDPVVSALMTTLEAEYTRKF